LENIKNVPLEFKINIRVNVDKYNKDSVYEGGNSKINFDTDIVSVQPMYKS
jgi:hypothetical protein